VNYKRDTVGFVWQNNARNLIPYLTALENVELPVLLKGRRRKARAIELLEAVGLGHRFKNKLSELSGGEQQRVAIAIALANEPRLLLADEPTGSLDTKTSDQVLDLFRTLNQTMGITIVIVTHDPLLARKVDRVVQIRDGKTSAEMIRRESYADELARLDAEDAMSGQQESHIEYAVLDKAGRLQIPAGYLDADGFKDSNKVRVEMEEGRIILYPQEMMP
jgi:ABC-type methionine transport system ATPase subunit